MYFSFLVSTFFVRYAENLLLFDGPVEDTVADLLKKMTKNVRNLICCQTKLFWATLNKVLSGYLKKFNFLTANQSVSSLPEQYYKIRELFVYAELRAAHKIIEMEVSYHNAISVSSYLRTDFV